MRIFVGYFGYFRKRPLIRSILALFSSAFVGRILGTVYRVALVRAAGQDAVGILQLAMPVYRITRSLATLGMPVAIAKVTAERTELTGKPDLAAYRLGLSIMLPAAIAAFLLQALFSGFWGTKVLTDSRTEPALVVLAVLLIPVAVSNALRGAVQGWQRQSYMAAADVSEALVRIPVVLGLAILLAPYGTAWVAAGVAIGLIGGELAHMGVLYAGFRRTLTRWNRRNHAPPAGSARLGTGTRTGSTRTHTGAIAELRARELLALSLPLMVTGLLNNLMSLVTVAMIPRLLQSAGLTVMEATREYGRLSGMAMPTIYMPMMLIFPVTSVALPEITRLAAMPEGRGLPKLYRLLVRVFLWTALVVVFLLPFFWYKGHWLAGLLYGDAGVGELIRPLTIALPFTYLGSVSMAALYGLGKTAWTMVSSMAGNILRVVVIWCLAGRPEFGIMGVLWAMVADSILTAVLAGGGLVWLLLFRLRR
ncbi:MAG TPA: oligosaccharide flippase family protein [Firmicutes bacterium]|nr:oligosaccharide flippase family protein [Bacillota bacterium]